MQKRVQIALAVLLVMLVGVIAWQVLREREPVYQGKRLSGWLQGYIHGGSYIGVQPEPEADEAVRQIGTNATSALLHMLRAHDSNLKLALWRLIDKQHLERIQILRVLSYWQAAVAFHALGASASNAVPILVQTYRDEICSDSQSACAEALGWIGRAASGAIPDLMSAVTNLDDTLRAVAVEALGHIHAEPELVLPVLTRSLRDSSSRVRSRAVGSLVGFGAEAKAAIPALTLALDDPVAAIRTNAAAALKAINPEAAVKAGVK